MVKFWRREAQSSPFHLCWPEVGHVTSFQPIRNPEIGSCTSGRNNWRWFQQQPGIVDHGLAMLLNVIPAVFCVLPIFHVVCQIFTSFTESKLLQWYFYCLKIFFPILMLFIKNIRWSPCFIDFSVAKGISVWTQICVKFRNYSWSYVWYRLLVHADIIQEIWKNGST